MKWLVDDKRWQIFYQLLSLLQRLHPGDDDDEHQKSILLYSSLDLIGYILCIHNFIHIIVLTLRARGIFEKNAI